MFTLTIGARRRCRTSATTTTPTSSATSGSSSDAHRPNTPPRRPGHATTRSPLRTPEARRAPRRHPVARDRPCKDAGGEPRTSTCTPTSNSSDAPWTGSPLLRAAQAATEHPTLCSPSSRAYSPPALPFRARQRARHRQAATRPRLVSMKEGWVVNGVGVFWCQGPRWCCGWRAALISLLPPRREDQATLEAGSGGACPKRAVRRPDETRRLPERSWVRRAGCG
jgi:hypothetical protein